MQEYVEFGGLALQVVAVAVVTFIVSAIFWTVAPHHKSEFKALPNEDAVRQALHEQGVTEGQWRIPFSENAADWKTPEFQERYRTGPVGILQLEKPVGMAMGRRLLQTFGFFFLVAFFTSYVLRHSLPKGTEYMVVFQVAGAVSFACHAFGHIQDAVWFSKSWKRVALQCVDAVVYSLITAGIFASTWPWA